jgi:hypothetical protein
MRKRAMLAALAMLVAACGGSDNPSTPTDTRITETFNGSLDDPNRCTCGNGINQYTITVATAGVLDATATFQPADAELVVRLLDSSFNQIFQTSTRSGNTARLSHNAAAGTYRMQVFMGGGGPRQATFSLAVTHP